MLGMFLLSRLFLGFINFLCKRISCFRSLCNFSSRLFPALFLVRSLGTGNSLFERAETGFILLQAFFHTLQQLFLCRSPSQQEAQGHANKQPGCIIQYPGEQDTACNDTDDRFDRAHILLLCTIYGGMKAAKELLTLVMLSLYQKLSSGTKTLLEFYNLLPA